MKGLNYGEHYGTSKNVQHLDGLTIISSTYYNQTSCPWHYHQNAHFAFTTKGNLIETHKKQKNYLSAGCLMYNHSQEPHCNFNYSEFVSALHIDINKSWFDKYEFRNAKIEGVHVLQNPTLKNLFINLYKEVRLDDIGSALTIESLMIQAISELLKERTIYGLSKPAWVDTTRDLLYAYSDTELTLEKIAAYLNIHPVYLCQQFPVYFHCTFGDYIRKIRVEKSAILMLTKPHISLTDIAYECGFSDQSHFIRVFKKHIGINPLAYRKTLGQ